MLFANTIGWEFIVFVAVLVLVLVGGVRMIRRR